ncbi:hypothetical protein MKX01_013398 [Papaver californicum]|nr:hypothetical protein MKX01_013398 [Papaver californicum]
MGLDNNWLGRDRGSPIKVRKQTVNPRLLSSSSFIYFYISVHNNLLQKKVKWNHGEETENIIAQQQLKICSPNLSTINYGKLVPANFVIDSFPSLVEADIDISYCKYNGGTAEKFVLIKLFEKLANVKLLKVSGTFFQILSQADILLNNLPAFNNLIHLEVGLISVARRFYRFLKLSPNLESIVFAKSIRFPDEEDDCWSLDPKCSLPHLKSIKFINFEGSPMELNAIKLFLNYTGFLETVTIVASPELSNHTNEQVNVMKLLLVFPR